MAAAEQWTTTTECMHLLRRLFSRDQHCVLAFVTTKIPHNSKTFAVLRALASKETTLTKGHLDPAPPGRMFGSDVATGADSRWSRLGIAAGEEERGRMRKRKSWWRCCRLGNLEIESRHSGRWHVAAAASTDCRLFHVTAVREDALYYPA